MCAKKKSMASISNLPQDLLIDILSRLPVEFLLRFRSVCKPWLALISTPNFIKAHLNRNKHFFIAKPKEDPDNTLSLFPHLFCLLSINDSFEDVKHLVAPKFPVNQELVNSFNCLGCISNAFGHRIDVVGSVNGLICLADDFGMRIYIWNPATRQVKHISDVKIEVINPTCANGGKVNLGFGYDEVNDDYKVVRLVWGPSRSGGVGSENCVEGRVEVYSVNEGCWRQIEVELDFVPNKGNIFIHGSCSAIVKGNPYWMLNRNPGWVYFVLFDVQHEVFRKIKWPKVDFAEGRRYPITIGEFKGSVAIMCSVCDADEGGNNLVYLWTMDDDRDVQSSWTTQFVVGPLSGLHVMVGCLKNGKIVAENKEGELLLYDPVKKEVKQTPLTMRSFGNHYYVESLVKC